MLKELVEKLLDLRPVTGGTVATTTEAGIPYAYLPDGIRLQSLKSIRDEERTKPQRRKGTVKTSDMESFIAVTNRFKADNTALFQELTIADNTMSASLKSVFNYHPAGADNTNADNADHAAFYDFPLSEELKVWLGKNKQPFNQKEFAEFLEDNIADLVVPKPGGFKTRFGDDTPQFATPSSIMALSRGIDIRVDEKVTHAFRTNDGSFTLQYTSENKDATGGKLNIPEWFALGIPVFEKGIYYQIPVRLRFRHKEGMVTWFYEMYRKNDTLRCAVHEASAEAITQTDLPLYSGKPENQ